MGAKAGVVVGPPTGVRLAWHPDGTRDGPQPLWQPWPLLAICLASCSKESNLGGRRNGEKEHWEELGN